MADKVNFGTTCLYMGQLYQLTHFSKCVFFQLWE